MSAVGVSLTLDGNTWVAMIVMFATLALVGFAVNFARHKNWFVAMLAVTGAGAIYYSYGVEFTEWIETAGLLVLLIAAITDYRALHINASAAKQAAN